MAADLHLNGACSCSAQPALWPGPAFWLLLGGLLAAACAAAGHLALQSHRRRHTVAQVGCAPALDGWLWFSAD